ncbi:hypothetical protein [Gordonia soli]|uniref:Uncharacterized protein n=1 Tax=Gordonia soli NBRC 108243 TaxID=1223545 RepID=M0QLS5_9ACTN|nr:hypothetical protein [Gordonia soli]GAC69349.1 hypothetical protein GS4_23_01460 [Gordonia soli NBRC 108243]
MDRSDDVAALVADGVEAERVGLFADAESAYRAAWEAAEAAHERCIAAHHLARAQPDPDTRLGWDREALRWAADSDRELVADFLPTALVAAAASARAADDPLAARDWYIDAAQHIRAADSSGDHDDALRAAIADGLIATAEPTTLTEALRSLGRARRYAALTSVLPRYIDWVLDDDVTGLVEAIDAALATDGISAADHRALVAALPTHATNDVAGADDVAFQL